MTIWSSGTAWNDTFALTAANLTVKRSGTSNYYAGIRGDTSQSSGKKVVKFTCNVSGTQIRFGLARSGWNGSRLGGDANGMAIKKNGDMECGGQDLNPWYTMPGAVVAAGVRYLLVDFDAGRVWLHDGTTYFPGNPDSVAGMKFDGTQVVPDIRGQAWFPAFGTEASETTSQVTMDPTAAGLTLPTGFTAWDAGGGGGLTNLRVKDAGTWKTVISPRVKDAGTWKTATGVWIKDAGTWKKVFG
jgi:hypothetical protein